MQHPTKTQKRQINLKNIKAFLALLVVILCAFPFFKECNRRNALKNESKVYIKAIVTYDKTYQGNSPVSHDFYYKYAFKVNGVEYFGKTMNEKYRPGDSIEIEYLIEDPTKNSPKDYYK